MKKTFYTTLDKRTGLDDDGFPIIVTEEIVAGVYAYSTEFSEGKTKYYIKVESDGSMVMPAEENIGREKIYRTLQQQNPEEFFRQVNKDAFIQYLMYLKTKNKLYYKLARRQEI